MKDFSNLISKLQILTNIQKKDTYLKKKGGHFNMK